jgi:perosamine synthetase
MHEQPIFQKMGLFKGEKYPIAEKLSRNGFYLPSGLGLSIDNQQIVIEIINE